MRHISTALLAGILLVVSIARLANGQLPAAQSAVLPLSLPMEYAQAHLFIELNDEQLGPLRFMVDTGAERTLLTKSAVEKARVAHHLFDRFYSFNGFGSSKSAKFDGHIRLHLHSGAAEIFAADALVVDRTGVQLGFERRVDGILGLDFFQNQCVRLDYREKRMEINAPDHCSPPPGAYTLKGKWMPEGMLLPAVATLADGRAIPLRLHLDTGSDTTLLLNPRLREAVGLPRDSTAKGDEGKGMNGSYRYDKVIAGDVELAGGHPHWSGAIPCFIGRRGSFSRPHWWTDGPGEAAINRDGVIGNALLSYWNWTFDSAAKQIYAQRVVDAVQPK
jgi:predicted aspartyl protease